jgi:hypothetical protein
MILDYIFTMFLLSCWFDNWRKTLFAITALWISNIIIWTQTILCSLCISLDTVFQLFVRPRPKPLPLVHNIVHNILLIICYEDDVLEVFILYDKWWTLRIFGVNFFLRDEVHREVKESCVRISAAIACWAVPDSILLCVPVALRRAELSRNNVSWTRRSLLIWFPRVCRSTARLMKSHVDRVMMCLVWWNSLCWSFVLRWSWSFCWFFCW